MATYVRDYMPGRNTIPCSSPFSRLNRDPEQSNRPWVPLYNGSGVQMHYDSEASATEPRGEVKS
jgi:hypothetical protein